MTSSSKFKCWIICTFLAVSIFTLSTLMPLIGLPLMLLYSVPVLIVTYEIGLVAGVTCSLAAASLLLVLSGPALSMIFLLTFAMQGIFLGSAAKKIKAGVDLVFSGLLISMFCKIVTVLVFSGVLAFSGLSGVNILSPGVEEIEKSVLIMWQSYLSKLTPAETQKFTEQLRLAIDTYVLLIPSFLIMFSCVEVMVNYFVSSNYHKKLTGNSYFSLPDFERWHFPKNILLAYVLGFTCEFLSEKRPDVILFKQVGINLVTITQALFVIEGLAVVYYLTRQRGFSRIFNIAMLVAVPLVAVLRGIFSLVGIIDIGFDLRKRFGRNDK